jgi:CSLREA domain-containing protein
MAAVACVAGFWLATGTAHAETFVVTQTGDPAPGACNAQCSLREAVDAANLSIGDDRVKLRAQTYRLTRSGSGENANATGDLDVLGSLEIFGRGARRTTIDGEWAAAGDRLIETLGGVDLTVRNLELRDGDGTGVTEIAAIDFEAPGDLRLTDARVISNRSAYTAVETNGDSFISRVIFRNNRATGCCAALYNRGSGEMIVRDVWFDRNTAVDDTGAVYSDGASAVFERVTFSRNRAGTVGGALITSAGTNELRNVTFSGNRSDGAGGGLYLESDATLNNATFFRNVADADDNDASGQGGGIYGSGGTATMSNTILAGNTEGGDGQNQCGGSPAPASLGHNLFGLDVGCMFVLGPGDIELEPGQSAGLVKRLRANGGFTPSHALKRSSRARNRGGNMTCEPRDQRKVLRPQGPRCDIGSYELKQ